ncbi:hypothetical protein [Pseudolabrys sp. Root1462]|uniref:hypothetical protein n=1 Tax=Pseudolabrys sp. Root1462 TaxID=1736466 RepID=UPI0012E34D4E|nr:hypothetical protein [Pseudolabrys sp. Root1462]
MRLAAKAELLGSGTLIDAGSVKGILTAAHVLQVILREREIGLLEFPVRMEQSQRLRVEIRYLDHVHMGDGPFGEEGPDLAFLRIPITLAEALAANSSFANFEKQAASAFAPAPLEASESIDAVLGTIGEWKEPVRDVANLRVTTLSGLHNVGVVTEIEALHGFDRYQFDPLPENGFRLPVSYGGTSGGGLWRAYTNNEKHLKQLRLLGVAYFQTGGIDRKIICHGPKSVYQALRAQMYEKWPREL